MPVHHIDTLRASRRPSTSSTDYLSLMKAWAVSDLSDKANESMASDPACMWECGPHHIIEWIEAQNLPSLCKKQKRNKQKSMFDSDAKASRMAKVEKFWREFEQNLDTIADILKANQSLAGCTFKVVRGKVSNSAADDSFYDTIEVYAPGHSPKPFWKFW